MENFVVLVSIFQMSMLYRFCTKYSDNPLLSFAIAYPTLYSTYFFSTMRQGLTMSIFLGLMYPLLKEKNYVPYYLLAASNPCHVLIMKSPENTKKDNKIEQRFLGYEWSNRKGDEGWFHRLQ